MALFKIQKGLASNLTANRPYTNEGYCYFTTDEGKFYIDIEGDGTSSYPAATNGKRICLNAANADTADKVNHALNITFPFGSTAQQNYNVYTFDGSVSKDLDFYAGSGISITWNDQLGGVQIGNSGVTSVYVNGDRRTGDVSISTGSITIRRWSAQPAV